MKINFQDIEKISNKSIDTQNLLDTLPSLIKLQQDKSKLYGRSYCNYGNLGIFFNLARKWDRVENIMQSVMKNGEDNLFHNIKGNSTATETFLDTVSDLAVYSMLWVGYIKENYPEQWEQFLKSNKLD